MKEKTILENILDIVTKAKDLGISGARLCRESNISPVTLHRWKAGKNRPIYDNFINFKNAYEDICKQRNI